MASQSSLEVSTVTGATRTSDIGSSPASQMVGESRQLAKGFSTTPKGPQPLSVYRCFRERLLPINILELKAVNLALKGFDKALTGQSILVCSDISSVVSYLNKVSTNGSLSLVHNGMGNCHRGSNQSSSCARVLDVIAGALSHRDKIIHSEWALHQKVFRKIGQTWHYPERDMFATF